MFRMGLAVDPYTLRYIVYYIFTPYMHMEHFVDSCGH